MQQRTQGDVMTTALLACGAIAGPLFVVVFLIEGATRADYNPLRHPVSSLALGDDGWTQTANFIVTGLLMLAFAVGLRRALRPRGGSWWGPLLVGIFAIGLLGAGIFPTDPVSGYPPGTPNQHVTYTTPGALHDLFSSLVFFGLPAACFVFARRFAKWGERGWALASALVGVAFIAGFFLSSVGFSQTAGFVDFGGLLQRITLAVGWGWLSLLAIHFLRNPVPE
jgi:hypothetical membrane protein